MGLIKAGMGALGGTLADQWKEFFYCDSLDKDVLMVKGQKRTSPPQLQQWRGQHHHQWQRHRRGRRPVHAHRGAGPRGGGVR